MQTNAMKRLFFLFLLCCQAVSAQVQFEAKASKAKLGVNERLTVTFTVNADGDNFTPPSFEGFRVFSGPFQSVQQMWVNGRGSFSKSYSYVLTPMQKGALTIRQASIEINGQVYKTTPLKVTITDAVAVPKDPYAPQVIGYDDLQLVADVSKSSPYVNEPITVEYKLYLGYNADIRAWHEVEKPKYNDFWSQNIDVKNPQVVETTYNGERTRMVVLRKTVLYPQKSGRLTIEPLSLDFDLVLPTNRRTFWGVQMQEVNKRVTTGTKVINVKALPEAGKPIDFTGAVGDFTFTAIPSRTDVKNGESLDLVVKVSGKGNLKLFDLPKPIVPNALEMYDPVHDENVSTPLSGMTGSISDKYTIIPQYKGNYPIKPMRFSYFDLSSGRYKTITSPEILIRVEGGPEAAVAAADSPQKRTVATSQQFQFIKRKTKLTPIRHVDFFGSPTFYSMVGIPFALLPMFLLFMRRREALDRDVAGKKSRAASQLARRYLGQARKQLGHKEAFYVALEKAMHNFLKAKLHIETSEMSKDKIREILLDRRADTDTVSRFIELMENCDFARYAPSTEGAMQRDYDLASQLLTELSKQI